MAPDCIELTLDELKKMDEEFEKYFIEAIQKQRCFSAETKCVDKLHSDISWIRIQKCIERSTNENVKKWYSLLLSFFDLSKKADKDYDLYFKVMEWPCYEEFQFKIEKYTDLLSSGRNDTSVVKITQTQREALLTELENCSKELFSVHVSKAQRILIWNTIAKTLNSMVIGPLVPVIEWQKIWLDIKFKTELRERQKLLGTSPEDMRILKICRITSIEECEIMKALESYTEFGVDTDHLKCECCELLKNNTGATRLCYACSKTNLVICDICLIKPSSKVYLTKNWSSTAKELIPTVLGKDTVWVCNACKANLLEQASQNWKVCRLCAEESEFYTPINNSFLSEFSKDFNAVFKQKLVFGLGLPSSICSKCFEQFESIKRFYNDVKRNQITLFQIHKSEFIGKFVGKYKSLLETIPNKPIGKMTVANSKSDINTSKANGLIKPNESCHIQKLSDGQIGNTSIRKIKIKSVTSLNAEIPQKVLTTTKCPISCLESTNNQISENILDQSFSMMHPNKEIFETSSKYFTNKHILSTSSQPHGFIPKRIKTNPKCEEIDSSSKTFTLTKNEIDFKKKENPNNATDITARHAPDPTPTSSDKSTVNHMSQNLLYQSSTSLLDKPPDKLKEHEVIQLIDDSLSSTQQAPTISDSEKNIKPIRQNTLYQLKRVTVSKKPFISMLVKTGVNIIKEEQETNDIESANNLQRLNKIKLSKRPFSKSRVKETKATSLKGKEPAANSIIHPSPFTFYQPYFHGESEIPSAPERITSSPCPYTPSNDNTLQEKNLIESEKEVDSNTFSTIESRPSLSSPGRNETTSICLDAFDEIKTEEITTPVVQLVETTSNSESHLNAGIEDTSKNEQFECYLSENQDGKCNSNISELLNRPGVKSFIFNSSTKQNVLIARNDSQVLSSPLEMEVEQENITNPFITSIFNGLMDIKEELSEKDPLGGEQDSGEEFKDDIDSPLYECEEIEAPPILTDYAVNKNSENEDESLQINMCETAKRQANPPKTLSLSSTKEDIKSKVGKRKTNAVDKSLKLIKELVQNQKKKVLTYEGNKERRRSLRVKINS